MIGRLSIIFLFILSACEHGRLERCETECFDRLPPCDRNARDAGEWTGPPGERYYRNYCDGQNHAREHCISNCIKG